MEATSVDCVTCVFLLNFQENTQNYEFSDSGARRTRRRWKRSTLLYLHILLAHASFISSQRRGRVLWGEAPIGLSNVALPPLGGGTPAEPPRNPPVNSYLRSNSTGKLHPVVGGRNPRGTPRSWCICVLCVLQHSCSLFSIRVCILYIWFLRLL